MFMPVCFLLPQFFQGVSARSAKLMAGAGFFSDLFRCPTHPLLRRHRHLEYPSWRNYDSDAHHPTGHLGRLRDYFAGLRSILRILHRGRQHSHANGASRTVFIRYWVLHHHANSGHPRRNASGGYGGCDQRLGASQVLWRHHR